MTSDTSLRPISPLRARMIEDMTVRGFNEHTRRDYVRHDRPDLARRLTVVPQPTRIPAVLEIPASCACLPFAPENPR